MVMARTDTPAKVCAQSAVAKSEAIPRNQPFIERELMNKNRRNMLNPRQNYLKANAKKKRLARIEPNID
jgi:hypothetical protein